MVAEDSHASDGRIVGKDFRGPGWPDKPADWVPLNADTRLGTAVEDYVEDYRHLHEESSGGPIDIDVVTGGKASATRDRDRDHDHDHDEGEDEDEDKDENEDEGEGEDEGGEGQEGMETDGRPRPRTASGSVSSSGDDDEAGPGRPGSKKRRSKKDDSMVISNVLVEPTPTKRGSVLSSHTIQVKTRGNRPRDVEDDMTIFPRPDPRKAGREQDQDQGQGQDQVQAHPLLPLLRSLDQPSGVGMVLSEPSLESVPSSYLSTNQGVSSTTASHVGEEDGADHEPRTLREKLRVFKEDQAECIRWMTSKWRESRTNQLVELLAAKQMLVEEMRSRPLPPARSTNTDASVFLAARVTMLSTTEATRLKMEVDEQVWLYGCMCVYQASKHKEGTHPSKAKHP